MMSWRTILLQQVLLLQSSQPPRRIAASYSRRSLAYSARPPCPNKTSSWERGAIQVKDADQSNPYLEAIRDTHDPSMHLKTVEDELKGTIGKALGRQGEKICYFTALMQKELDKHQSLLQESVVDTVAASKAVDEYNAYRERALTARWELTVHRQAAGFIVNNHKYVTDHYPIEGKLEHVEENDGSIAQGSNTTKTTSDKPKQKFGDQLDWWQTIGRWRG